MSEAVLEGYVHEVVDGMLYARLFIEGEEFEMEMPFLSVPECQRQYVQPGSYFTLLNGYMLVNKDLYTTYELEQADKRAEEWAASFSQKP